MDPLHAVALLAGVCHVQFLHLWLTGVVANPLFVAAAAMGLYAWYAKDPSPLPPPPPYYPAGLHERVHQEFRGFDWGEGLAEVICALVAIVNRILATVEHNPRQPQQQRRVVPIQ